MHIKNTRRWAPSGIHGYLIALAGCSMALGIRLSLHGILGPSLPFLTFLLAAFLVEYRYGLGPAILLSVLSLPLGLYYFVPPFGSLDLFATELSDIFTTIGYFMVIGLGIVLIETLQRARYGSRLIADVSRSRYEILLRAESERQSALAAARLSREHFQTFAAYVGDVIYMKRVGGGFEYINDLLAKKADVLAESLIGGNWLSIMHPDDADIVAEQMIQVIDNQQPTLSEFRVLAANGGYVTFEGKISAMEDESGLMIKWTGEEVVPQPNDDSAPASVG